MNTFDHSTHTYAIDGRIAPSVTQVLRDVLGAAQWQASEWHLQRGRAVHACAAMVLRGTEFEHDEQLTGQVAAVRKWWASVQPARVIAVEVPLYSVPFQYAGTPDAIVEIEGCAVIVDFKSSLTDLVKIQVGGYALLYGERVRGFGVQLNTDGTFKATEPFKTDRYKHEFMACLSVYNIRRRLKIQEESENE